MPGPETGDRRSLAVGREEEIAGARADLATGDLSQRPDVERDELVVAEDREPIAGDGHREVVSADAMAIRDLPRDRIDANEAVPRADEERFVDDGDRERPAGLERRFTGEQPRHEDEEGQQVSAAERHRGIHIAPGLPGSSAR